MQYNHDTFEQWWEFLKLSENYHSICDLVSIHREDAPEFPLKKLLDELEKNEKFNKSIEKYMKLLAVYEKFGDVHQNNFEAWWENYNKPKSVKTKTKLDEYKEEKYRRINAAMAAGDEQLQLYEEIRGDIIYFPDTYVQLYVNIHSPISNIKSDINSVVKELKKEEETNKREKIDERNKYLEILRLSLKGDRMPRIIETIGTPSERQDPRGLHTLRSYRKKKKNALLILHSVEEGRFP
ncbi:MAG: hypothetical protein ABSD50_06400 [Smithella sp.]|jgi:hypothetical protein